MTPTLDTALLSSSRAGTDLGRLIVWLSQLLLLTANIKSCSSSIEGAEFTEWKTDAIANQATTAGLSTLDIKDKTIRTNVAFAMVWSV